MEERRDSPNPGPRGLCLIVAHNRAIVPKMPRKYIARLGVRELLRIDRKRGARAVVALVRRHRGSITGAAEAAGVHHATFKRWIADHGLRMEIEIIRARFGLSPARTPARAARCA